MFNYYIPQLSVSPGQQIMFKFRICFVFLSCNFGGSVKYGMQFLTNLVPSLRGNHGYGLASLVVSDT